MFITIYETTIRVLTYGFGPQYDITGFDGVSHPWWTQALVRVRCLITDDHDQVVRRDA